MDMKNANELKQFIESTSTLFDNYKLYVICNTKSHQPIDENFNKYDIRTEYLSNNEFGQVDKMLNSCIPVEQYFFDEIDFIKFICTNNIDTDNMIVYNSAQSGTGIGRKSLIPAFCAYRGIRVTGSNSYVVALCRHKYHVIQLLKAHGFCVPNTYIYNHEWLSGEPVKGEKYIIKPIYESSSIGIDQNSIIIYDENSLSVIEDKSKEMRQPIIVQQFIDGYETEVPCISTNKDIYVLNPVGICLNEANKIMGENILDYERVYYDNYRFFDLSEENINVDQIREIAYSASKILGLSGLCRIDFRIKKNGKYYITDISTNPHFVEHSSVGFAFNIANMTSDMIMKTILCAALCF